MDRVTAVSPWRKYETELELISGGLRRLDETSIYKLSDARIAGPMLYAGANRFDVGNSKDELFLDSPHERLDTANLVSTWSGTRWFGCLLMDDFPLEMIPTEPGTRNIAMIGTEYRHLKPYRDLLGLGEIQTVTNAYVRQLNVYRGLNYHFHTPHFRALRSQLRERLPIDAQSSGAPVYIRRGTDGEHRLMANEDELVEKLVKWGFVIVSPEQDSVEEIVRKTLDSPLVISVEGSQLSNAIFTMAENATLLVIQPPFRFAMIYKEFTDSMDMNFGFVVGEPSGDGSFKVVISELEELLHKVGY